MKEILCLVFVLFSATGIFAQEKTIEKSEFDAIRVNSYRKFAGQAYRQTESTQDILANQAPRLVSKMVREQAVVPVASHMVLEFYTTAIMSRRETINIGGKTYTRNGGSEWTEGKLEIKPRAESPLKTVEDQTEYKSLGKEILDNQTTNVYATIQRKKLINESKKQELFSTITTKYWFGEDGGIIKQETQMDDLIKSERNPVGSVYRHVRAMVWELDPNIKIEAPITRK